MITYAPFYTNKCDLLYYIDEDGKEHRISNAKQWQIRRQHILLNMQKVMGPLPDESKRVPLDPSVEEEVEDGSFIRRKISYCSEPNDRTPAYLLIPEKVFRNSDHRLPAMLCLHQTVQIGKDEPVGLGGNPNLHYAKELAERGYVALAPDYCVGGGIPEVNIKEGFGEYRTDPYTLGYQSATMKGIWNHIRGVDLLQSLPFVDPDRIGVIGHSLGGYNSLFVSAFDERIKVVVASAGFTSFQKYRGGDLTGWSHRGHMPKIATEYDKDPNKMPFEFSEILGVIAPRSLFISAPLQDDIFEVSGVADCVASAIPVFSLLGGPGVMTVVYPPGPHDFPPFIREMAYRFIDRILKNGAELAS
ncbi:MAG: prolyl oligopeptidase family serine peptidase [Armatimonadetes bacterium]|nr:prolyl oligopeptidase family serine peptidase [Armatimonadota bacterium]MDW8121630.1 prolyl oligopeptidase family serine peptidase [Armatimonadota bacterium]